MARHDPDATRNVSVVPELPENKKRTAEVVTHSACTGWSRTARLAGGAPSLAAFVQRASLAALQLSVVTHPNLHHAASSTGRPSLPTGGRVSLPYKHNVGVVKNAFCLLQRQQRPKSVVNFFFGLPGDTYDGLAFTMGFWPPLVRRLAGIPRRFSLRGFRRTFGRANCKRL